MSYNEMLTVMKAWRKAYANTMDLIQKREFSVLTDSVSAGFLSRSSMIGKFPILNESLPQFSQQLCFEAPSSTLPFPGSLLTFE